MQPDVLVDGIGQLYDYALVLVRGQCGLQQPFQFPEQLNRRLAIAVGPMVRAVGPSLGGRVRDSLTTATVVGD
jgi:hypothetical protein